MHHMIWSIPYEMDHMDHMIWCYLNVLIHKLCSIMSLFKGDLGVLALDRFYEQGMQYYNHWTAEESLHQD